MPLREHLRELRNRFLKSGLAVLIGSAGGWMLYDAVWARLKAPLDAVSAAEHMQANININAVASPFNLKLKLAVYLGLVIASPVWLYQLWAFIVPGLTKKEKKYAVSFVAVAVPLFLAGLGLAYQVLPNAIKFFAGFTPKGAVYLINADDYVTFVTQVFLAFGVAFVIPLLLVALNMAGVLPAAVLARGWRIAVFLTFLFAAIASPTPDAGSMLALAFPMTGLYVVAVGIAALNDRRRRRRDAAAGFGGLSDDEASPLDTTPTPVPEPAAFDEL